jgi:hypothetical protein
VQADGTSGLALDDVWSTWADVAVAGRRSAIGEWGVLAGWTADRRLRSGNGVHRTDRDTGAYALARSRFDLRGWRADVAFRFDRLPSGQDAWAPGATLSRRLGPRDDAGMLVWAHTGRIVDRPTIENGVLDFYAQANQGVDLPVDVGGELDTGLGAAAGVRWESDILDVEGGIAAERVERWISTSVDERSVPLDPTEVPEAARLTTEVASAWGAVAWGPIKLGGLGRLRISASGSIASNPDGGSLAYVPRRTGRAEVRLRRDLFRSNLRFEGALFGEVMSTMATSRGPIPEQGQINARISIRIRDIVLFYRSENLFGSDFRSSAYDIDTSFAPTTARNVNLGLSWILVD